MPFCTAVATGTTGDATPSPFFQINAASNRFLIIREIKVFTTAANASRILVKRYSTSAPTGTAVTEEVLNNAEIAYTPVATAVHSLTADSTDEGTIDIGAVGAQIGSGFVYTYYGEGKGIYVPAGANNGVGLVEFADTANTYDVCVIWEE